MLRKSIKAIGLVGIVFVATACSDSREGGSSDSELRAVIEALGHTADPSSGRALPEITDAKAQLGMKLFFTKGLGGNRDAACVTCHHPALGGGDNLSLSIGVNAEIADLLGPGRFHDMTRSAEDNNSHFDGGPTVPRNAPSTFNIGLWDEVLFLDGRVESLEKSAGQNGAGDSIRTPDSSFGVADLAAGPNLTAAQTRFPVTSPEEMRGFTFEAGGSNDAVRGALATRLSGLNAWETEFQAAFGDPSISYARIADAIAEYERSQVFIQTPWKSYVQGDNQAISEAAKRGALLFFQSFDGGGANCVSCHSGDFFTDESFHVVAMPQIGRGKGDGLNGDDDFGRERETGLASDRYKFRTPSLLNVELTGPWGHAGAHTTLRAAVLHMLNPSDALANYDFSQLDPTLQASNMLANTQLALDQLTFNRNNDVVGVHRDVPFEGSNVDDLLEFLRALTDPCAKDRACLAPWIPDASDTNPDNLRLNAVDRNGSFL